MQSRKYCSFITDFSFWLLSLYLSAKSKLSLFLLICCATFCRASIISCGSVGLSKKDFTSYCMAICAYSKSSYPVRIINSVGMFSLRACATSSIPLKTGILMSIIAISTGSSFSRLSASAPFAAMPASSKSNSSHGRSFAIPSRIIRSSSTIKIL